MEDKVRSLRLKKELWNKIEECAKKCDLSVNLFCAKMLDTICDSFLQSKKEDNGVINGKDTNK